MKISPLDHALQKANQMTKNGITRFEWKHSGVPLNCGNEDHSKRDGKKYNIEKYLNSGQILPSAIDGCCCTFIAVID